jgi:NTP pyrophosphatase (non-canonical NTP hydrolase)
MDEQRRVAAFLDAHDLRTDPAYRVLDLSSEVGELAKEVNESTGYGSTPGAAAVAEDEVGDALFCLLALAAELDVEAGEALETAIEKYESRLASSGDPGSGA